MTMPENAQLATDSAATTELAAAKRDEPSAPPLRRLPVRISEPPFDEHDGNDRVGGESVQGALALAFALPSGVPAVPSGPSTEAVSRRLALVPPLAPATVTKPDQTAASQAEASQHAPRAGRKRVVRDADIDDFGPQRTPRALLPEPQPWAGRLVQAIVEITAGVRPIAQLVRWTTSDVYESVCRRTAHLATVRDRRRTGAIVRSVHVDEPGEGVAEVCAVVQQGNRCRAIALRLEGVDGRWQCTALQVG
jgi:Family of unknown function (DUF6459)